MKMSVVPSNTIFKLQSESGSFPSLLDAPKSSGKIVNCETSHIRTSESDVFKKNLPDERRKNLYSSCIKQRVVPNNALNSHYKNRVMHLWSKNAKQLGSVPSQSSVSANLTTVNEDDEELLKMENAKCMTKKSANWSKDFSIDYDKETSIITYLKTIDLDFVVIKRIVKTDTEYFLDYSRKILFVVSNKIISKWILGKYSNYSLNVIKKKNFKLFVVKPKMESQGIFDAFTSMFTNIHNTGKFLTRVVRNYNNPQLVAWVIDFLTLTMELNDPFFWRPVSMLKFLARLYSATLRYTDFKNSTLMSSQSIEELTGVDSIMLVLSCFGLPEGVMKGLKHISTMTNKKILDSPNIIMELINKFLEVCYDLLLWIKETMKFEAVDFVIDLIIQPLHFVKGLKLTTKISKITTDFQRDNQIIFDPVVRLSCTTLFKEAESNKYIQAMLANPAYKLYAQQYSTLQVMHKLSSNFDISARNEPVCIVFEGKAGSGKSTFMNKVVDYLTKKNYSVYNHSCPAVEASKDWYDDYLNQDIFVMDDVGQQGVSQWRQIINFVSPVKFPLECAEAKNKNTKFFNSKLLLLTTNHFSDLHSFTKADCITEPAALFRRCHVLNFDNVHFNDGVMTGFIQYKKYDYVRHEWTNSFIGPHKNCKLQTTCDVSNQNRSIAWSYSLIFDLLRKQAEMYDNNCLSTEDEVDIDSYVEQIKITSPSFIPRCSSPVSEDTYFDSREDSLTSQNVFSFLSDVTAENLGMFKEYLCNIVGKSYEYTTSLFDTLRTDPVILACGKMLAKEIFIGIFSVLITVAGKRLYMALVGNVEPEELTLTTFNEQIVKSWQGAHDGYIKRTVPSMIVDSGNDVLNEIAKNKPELSTRVSSLRSKMRIIQLIGQDGFVNTAQGIVSGRRAVVQTHSYSTLQGTANIFKDWSCYGNNTYECNNIPYKVIREWPEYDMAVVEISLTIPLYKDATNSLFSKDVDVESPYCARNLFFVNAQAALSLDNNFTINLDAFQIQNATKTKTFLVQPNSGISYPLTAPGLCGSLLVDSEFGMCGIHVAGNLDIGFAFILPKRTLRELKSLLSFKSSLHLDIKDNVDENFSGIKIFNEVFPAKRPLQKTSLAKSELHSILEEEVKEVGEKVPPNFSVFKGKTLEEMANKSFKPIPHIPHRAIEFAKTCISQFLIPFEELSDKETIKGIKEEELSALNKDSVNGFGYGKDKTKYINFSSGEITPEFAKKLEQFRVDCNTDNVQVEDLLFYEAFKDELRLTEKKDKPRTFRVAPLHHTFLVKKYMGKLFSHCKKNMWFNQIAIGMNPYKDWNQLYKRAKACFINFDGDFGNWDGGAPAQIQDAISELIMTFYKGSDPKTLKVLLDSMVRTFVLIKEKLRLTTHSMPSGCWVTAFFNSLINRMLTACVLFLEMEKDGKEATVELFNELFDAVLGDDKMCGSPAHLAKYFNAITMRDFATSIGMKYTDGDKGEITEPSKSLSDCVFLKRGFRYHKKLDKVVGPLSLTTLVNSLRYYDSSRDYDEIMSGKLTAFQFEMFLHENEALKEKVLNAADLSSFFFHKFDDEHIIKTMQDDETYARIMAGLGKQISNFL